MRAWELAWLCSLVLGPHPANCHPQFDNLLGDVWFLPFPLIAPFQLLFLITFQKSQVIIFNVVAVLRLFRHSVDFGGYLGLIQLFKRLA